MHLFSVQFHRYELILALHLLNAYKISSHGKMPNFGMDLSFSTMNLQKLGDAQKVLNSHVIKF
jgi:hypothetical protein